MPTPHTPDGRKPLPAPLDPKPEPAPAPVVVPDGEQKPEVISPEKPRPTLH